MLTLWLQRGLLGILARKLVLSHSCENVAHLQVLSKRLRLDGGFDFREIARLTPGFVGADLGALTQEAAALAVRRAFAAFKRPAEQLAPADTDEVSNALNLFSAARGPKRTLHIKNARGGGPGCATCIRSSGTACTAACPWRRQ